jgi:hypothetical protein
MKYNTARSMLIANLFVSSPWVVATLTMRPNNLFAVVAAAVMDTCFIVSAVLLFRIRRYAK